MPSSRFSLLPLLMFFLLLQGCSILQPPLEWPADAPPKDHYTAYYAEDAINREQQSLDNYLLWVTRFYAGLNLIPGWNAITERVMENIPEEDRVQVAYRMRALGRNISSEWAKEKEDRLINRRLVNVWREAFLEAEKTEDLMSYLTRLEDDVAGLLNGNLRKDDIHFERYYEDSFGF